MNAFLLMTERQAQLPRTRDQVWQDVKRKERPPYPSKVDVWRLGVSCSALMGRSMLAFGEEDVAKRIQGGM
jgi:hypothetical protein